MSVDLLWEIKKVLMEKATEQEKKMPTLKDLNNRATLGKNNLVFKRYGKRVAWFKLRKEV